MPYVFRIKLFATKNNIPISKKLSYLKNKLFLETVHVKQTNLSSEELINLIEPDDAWKTRAERAEEFIE